MGLDVSAYEKLTPGGDEDVDVRLYANPDFPGRSDPFEDGVYVASGQTMDVFGASYGTYNRWRAELSQAALDVAPEAVWSGKVTKGPFVEMINFSDCEGTIAGKTARKLANDFKTHRKAVLARVDPATLDYFTKVYDSFKAAFAMAAAKGAVVFH